MCRGGNPITFATTNEASVLILERCGLKESDVEDELGCTDNGDCVCPGCYNDDCTIENLERKAYGLPGACWGFT